MKRLKRYEQIFDLTHIEDISESNVEMVDAGIIGFIESAMMDRVGRKVRVVITVCRKPCYHKLLSGVDENGRT